MMQFNFIKNVRGFTLVEALVAISIISLSVAGPLTSASSAIKSAESARDRLIATYLAQEGVEYVRAMRDEEFLKAIEGSGTTVSDTAWNNFVSGDDDHDGSISECKSPDFCTYDPKRQMGTGSDKAMNRCSGGADTCPALYLNSSGMYTQQSSSGTQTPFKRSIQATVVSPTEERVVSTVTWSSRGVTHSVSTSVILTPWQ